MASSFAWGIDIGNRALKAVKLVRDGDSVKVDDFEVIEHETVLSNAGDNKDTLIASALAGFVQRHPMKGGVVGVGVSGQASFARFIKLPPVEPKKIPEIVKFEAIQQIPFPLDDVEWSYQLFQSAESPDVEVGIFAMRKELVNQHIRAFTDVDLNVQVVQMNPLAVYNALQHDGRFDKGPTMVIDLGAENTDLIIADNNSIWMRSIPIGGNNFTETLVKAFKLPFAKAEDLKRNSATSKYARQIFQAMRPVFADLVAEIQRSVGFYASVHRDSRIKKVLALGGTFRLPGLQKYLQQNLSMEIERLDRIAAGAPSDPKIVPTFNENLLSVVSAYGLALQALGDTKITSSLLPAKIRREKMWKEKTQWFGAAAALFVLGSALAAGKYLFQSLQFDKGQKSYASQIDAVKAQATKLDADWSAVENVGSVEQEQTKDIGRLGAYRTLWRDLLVDTYRALPVGQKDIATSQPSEAEIEKIKKIARSQRRVILIDEIRSRYVDGFGLIAGDPQFARYASESVAPPGPSADGSAPPMAEGAAAQNASLATSASHGFIMVIRCTSPYENALEPQNLFERDFKAKLLDIKPSEKRKIMEYAVARVELVSANKVKGNPTRMQSLRQQYDAQIRAQQTADMQNAPTGAARPGTPLPTYGGAPAPGGARPPGTDPGLLGGSGAAGAVNPADLEAFKDPTLKESVLEDWEFEVIVGVVIDPPPFVPSTPAPQASLP